MSTLKDLYIIGAGGFGREVAWLVERINEIESAWNLKGFIDDNTATHGSLQDDYIVVGDCDYLMNITQEVWVVCAVGSAKIRRKIIEKLKNYANVKFATLIDPSVMRSERVDIGEGSIICAGTINPSDGLIGCVHPVGASRCRMFLDIYKQASGNAGDYQVMKNGNLPRNGMMLNIGGTATTNYVFVVGI